MFPASLLAQASEKNWDKAPEGSIRKRVSPSCRGSCDLPEKTLKFRVICYSCYSEMPMPSDVVITARQSGHALLTQVGSMYS